MKNKLKLILIGLSTGFINGLFGSGGGLLIVPSLIYILNIERHKAHATAISIILPLSIISTYIYMKNNLIDFNIVFFISIGAMIGSFFGAKFLNKISTTVLKKAFSLLIIYISIRLIIL
ncbi:MAG: TSUP family transporter [Senegalia sp. (in: firmicutes)]|uniref:TSUP family transporter n=1 Tax=Senegalia sp. (in: firmicutes) TaxID=1924098 RepID=UPI003F97399B